MERACVSVSMTIRLQWSFNGCCWSHAGKIHKQAKFCLKFKALTNFLNLLNPDRFTFPVFHIIKRQSPPLLYGCTHIHCMVVGWFVLFYTIFVHVCPSIFCVFRFANWAITEKHNIHLIDKKSYKVMVNGSFN